MNETDLRILLHMFRLCPGDLCGQGRGPLNRSRVEENNVQVENQGFCWAQRLHQWRERDCKLSPISYPIHNKTTNSTITRTALVHLPLQIKLSSTSTLKPNLLPLRHVITHNIYLLHPISLRIYLHLHHAPSLFPPRGETGWTRP